jgi:hypothetical protein
MDCNVYIHSTNPNLPGVELVLSIEIYFGSSQDASNLNPSERVFSDSARPSLILYRT